MPKRRLGAKIPTLISASASSFSERVETSGIRELREGLFCITWYDRTSKGRRAITDLLSLKEKIQSCEFNYYDVDGSGVTLEMRIQLTETTKPENMLVYATKDGVQQKMTFGDCWTAYWNNHVTLCACGYCSPELLCEDCGEPAPTFGFEVLIDLTPKGSVPVKEGKLYVLQYLSKLWKEKIQSDVTFKLGEGKSIKAHALIVSSGSPLLASKLENNLEKNKDLVIPIKETKAQVFESLLRYIYTGELVAEEDIDLEEILIAANEYGIDALREECGARMSKYVTVANASRYLISAYENKSPKLHESALDFMSKNAKAVRSRPDWMELMKNYPELCFQAMELMLAI